MSFVQFFIFAIVMTMGASIATVIVAAQEFQARRSQRRNQVRIFTPANGAMDDDAQALAPSAELLHAVRQLG